MTKDFYVEKTNNKRFQWEIRLDLRSEGGQDILICATAEEKQAKWIIHCLELGRKESRNKDKKPLDAMGISLFESTYGKISVKN